MRFMRRREALTSWLTAATFALAAVFLTAPQASAGQLWDWLCGNCPPPAYYSPARYWTPGLARLNDYCHGPKISVYAPNRHPEIPVDYTVLTFPCPPVLPGATLIPVPVPPPESKFEYFEGRHQNINPTIPPNETPRPPKPKASEAPPTPTPPQKSGGEAPAARALPAAAGRPADEAPSAAGSVTRSRLPQGGQETAGQPGTGGPDRAPDKVFTIKLGNAALRPAQGGGNQ
jgi:hypothetical protein